MNNKDVVDYLNEKRQLELKLKELKTKKDLLPTEITIFEEVEQRLIFVNSQIKKLS